MFTAVVIPSACVTISGFPSTKRSRCIGWRQASAVALSGLVQRRSSRPEAALFSGQLQDPGAFLSPPRLADAGSCAFSPRPSLRISRRARLRQRAKNSSGPYRSSAPVLSLSAKRRDRTKHARAATRIALNWCARRVADTRVERRVCIRIARKSRHGTCIAQPRCGRLGPWPVPVCRQQ
jgi:hypothetical protein